MEGSLLDKYMEECKLDFYMNALDTAVVCCEKLLSCEIVFNVTLTTSFSTCK